MGEDVSGTGRVITAEIVPPDPQDIVSQSQKWVIVQVQLLQLRQSLNFGREARKSVVGEVQHRQGGKLANLGRK
jgi:hypothetical protein